METISIEASKIKPNPFKKFINGGKLEEEIVERLVEGFKQTKFHENLTGRRNKKGEVELIYGHHRLEAVKIVYGKDFIIHLKVYSYAEFPDENMLIDMIRENLTHRGDSYRDTADSIMLTKKWLETKQTANLLGKKTHKNNISINDIAKFLSFQGKTISDEQVSKYIDIEQNLHPDLKKKITKKTRAGTINKGVIGFEVASDISKFDKKEQKRLYEMIIKSGANKDKVKRLLIAYRNSSDETKEKAKEGKIDLEDIPMENLKHEIKKKADEKAKDEDKKIVVTQYKRFLRDAGNKVGETNTKIFQTCAYLDGLEQSGVLYELDWQEIHDIIELGIEQGKRYTKFGERILSKL